MTTESEIVYPTLCLLSETSSGRLPMAAIRRGIKARVKLDESDLGPLLNRPDQKIDQKVRNLKSHRRSQGNPIGEGLIEDVPGGLAITEKGRVYLKQNE